MKSKKNNLLGAISLICTMIFSSTLSLSFAQTGKTSNNIIALITASAAALLAAIVLLLFKGKSGFIIKSPIKWYIARAALTSCATYCWIHSAKTIGPSQTVLIMYSTPIWTMITAAALGIERIKKLSLLGILICLSAIFFTSTSMQGAKLYDIGIAFISSICFGLYDIFCRKQGDAGEHTLTQAVYSFVFTALILLPFGIYSFMYGIVEQRDLLISLSLAPVRFCIVLSIYLAYKLTSINIITPMEYLRLPVLLVMSFLLLNQRPEIKTVLCGIFIIFVNAVIFLYSSKREKKQQAANDLIKTSA